MRLRSMPPRRLRQVQYFDPSLQVLFHYLHHRFLEMLDMAGEYPSLRWSVWYWRLLHFSSSNLESAFEGCLL